MLTIRVTGKIAKRLKTPLEQNPPASTGQLGDCYANLLIIQRQHLLLLVSERTLLPVLIPAKDLASFPERLPAAFAEILGSIGIPDGKIQTEMFGMAAWSFAKTANRQVLGSMNDFANMLEAYMDDGAPLQQQALRLARCPCGPLGMDNPISATATLFGEKVSSRAFDFDSPPMRGMN